MSKCNLRCKINIDAIMMFCNDKNKQKHLTPKQRNFVRDFALYYSKHDINNAEIGTLIKIQSLMLEEKHYNEDLNVGKVIYALSHHKFKSLHELSNRTNVDRKALRSYTNETYDWFNMRLKTLKKLHTVLG